jgi:hypothetical protein
VVEDVALIDDELDDWSEAWKSEFRNCRPDFESSSWPSSTVCVIPFQIVLTVRANKFYEGVVES